jgi:histidinol-phosphate aminotransferase
MSDAWRETIRRPLRAEAAYHVPAATFVAKLDANESPWPLSDEARADLAAALAVPDLHRYPDANTLEVRRVLAARLGVEPDNLSIGNGSDESLGLLVAAFGEPREGRAARVLYPAPGFVVYRTVCLSHGLEPVEVPLGPRFEARPEALFEAMRTARPNLLFLATPNNPTGTMWPLEVVERLVREHPETIVVVDEAYAAYSGAPSAVPLALAQPNCLVVQTLSKIGLAGLRLGYVVGRREVITELEKVRPPYNLDTLSQRAACVLLSRHGDALAAAARAVVEERARLAAALLARGFEVFPSGGNFVLVRVADAAALHRRLASQGVAVRCFDRPGTALAGCLRITVGTPDENALLLARLDG